MGFLLDMAPKYSDLVVIPLLFSLLPFVGCGALALGLKAPVCV